MLLAKMLLSEKQQLAFVERYKDRYQDKDVIDKTSEELLGISHDADKKQREAFIRWLLWKKANTMYKHRARWKETVFQKVFNCLRLAYSPKWT